MWEGDAVTLVDILAALAIAIGLAGILVPVLPGTLLILAALLAWAVSVGDTTAWVVFAVATVVLAAGTIVKFSVPGKHMKQAGVPNSTLMVGAVAGIVGFFVIPVLGLVIGFVLGVYAAEVRRVGESAARRTTVTALKAAGLSILIELAAGLLAALAFAVGVILT
ncbi:hypothetical protein ASD30_03630 [Nocardioides sp. Root140]|nr:hypothetical protein ASD30_03630 [Nocardioides sp. Root140]KRF16076.1 hypothetical protein ASH02_05600 [Nocardioides sp. Soil796]